MKMLALVTSVAVLALGSSAFAAGGSPQGASPNANCLGQSRSVETRQPFGQAQSEFIAEMHDSGFVFEGQAYTNYGSFLNAYKDSSCPS